MGISAMVRRQFEYMFAIHLYLLACHPLYRFMYLRKIAAILQEDRKIVMRDMEFLFDEFLIRFDLIAANTITLAAIAPASIEARRMHCIFFYDDCFIWMRRMMVVSMAC